VEELTEKDSGLIDKTNRGLIDIPADNVGKLSVGDMNMGARLEGFDPTTPGSEVWHMMSQRIVLRIK